MFHPLRGTLLDLVLERAASINELAVAVQRPPSTVAYHVGVLTDADLLRVVRTRRRRAVDERLYGRTARIFYVGAIGPEQLTLIPNLLTVAAAASAPAQVGLVHADDDHGARCGGEGGDGVDGGFDGGEVGEDAGEEGADGEAAVAPEPVDADGSGPPGGVGDVADGGEQGGVDHGGADAERDGPGGPGPEAGDGGHPCEGGGLGEHAAGDEGFAADAVGEAAGVELAEAPRGRIERSEDADSSDGDTPAAAKKMGNRPQARPSLRLLTSPACEHDDRALSRKEVSRKTSPVDSASWWSALA
jgi:DNA-binding transcriptional ArsR family regulator